MSGAYATHHSPRGDEHSSALRMKAARTARAPRAIDLSAGRCRSLTLRDALLRKAPQDEGAGLRAKNRILRPYFVSFPPVTPQD